MAFVGVQKGLSAAVDGSGNLAVVDWVEAATVQFADGGVDHTRAVVEHDASERGKLHIDGRGLALLMTGASGGGLTAIRSKAVSFSYEQRATFLVRLGKLQGDELATQTVGLGSDTRGVHLVWTWDGDARQHRLRLLIAAHGAEQWHSTWNGSVPFEWRRPDGGYDYSSLADVPALFRLEIKWCNQVVLRLWDAKAQAFIALHSVGVSQFLHTGSSMTALRGLPLRATCRASAASRRNAALGLVSMQLLHMRSHSDLLALARPIATVVDMKSSIGLDTPSLAMYAVCRSSPQLTASRINLRDVTITTHRTTAMVSVAVRRNVEVAPRALTVMEHAAPQSNLYTMTANAARSVNDAQTFAPHQLSATVAGADATPAGAATSQRIPLVGALSYAIEQPQFWYVVVSWTADDGTGEHHATTALRGVELVDAEPAAAMERRAGRAERATCTVLQVHALTRVPQAGDRVTLHNGELVAASAAHGVCSLDLHGRVALAQGDNVAVFVGTHFASGGAPLIVSANWEEEA